MRTKQPQWKMVANLGDVNPVEYGGFFVYVDRTGVYPPEVELLESPESDSDPSGWTVSRAIIERTPDTEWWYRRLGEVAASCGRDAADLQVALKSGDVIEQAAVYRDLIGYFGPHEFDSYPNHYSKRSELPRRIRRIGQ